MLDVSGIILSLFYIVILIGALIILSRRLKIGFSAKSITIFFLYYYLFFILTTWITYVPDLSDTELFAKIITENYYPPNQSLGVRLFYFATFPLRILSLFKVEIFILFQIFIFELSLMILWKSWQIVLVKNGHDKHLGMNLYLLLAATYPAFLIYIPIPLREFFIFLGFTVMVYGLVDKYYNGNGLFQILLGSTLLLIGRPQLIVIVIIFLAFFQKNKVLKYSFIVASIFLIPLLYTSLTSFRFSPDFFEYMRNHSFSKYGDFAYGRVDWDSYTDIIFDLPTLTLQFVLSPLPILHERSPIDFLAIFIDVLFSIFIYMSTLYAGFRMSKIYLFIFIVSATLFGIWEFHIVGAARHRMPLIAILLPAASYGMIKFYTDITRKK